MFKSGASTVRVAVSLDLPDHHVGDMRWPLPSEIPWTEIDVPAWQAAYVPVDVSELSATARYRAIASSVEASLNGFVSSAFSLNLFLHILPS